MGFSVMNKICLAAIYVCVSIELVAHAVPQHSVGQLINADVKATHVLKEMAVSRSDIVRGDRALSSQIHDVIFVVKRLNVDKMELNLQEISDHTNPKYGHHLTKKMIDEITSNPTSRRHVMDHLTAIGATIISDTPYGDHHITARATVGLWEELFQTEFHSYTHASEKRNLKVLRARKYSIPLSLDAHVSSVYNTVQAPFSKSRRPSAKSANPSLSDITSRKLTFLHPHTTTPQLLYNAYGVRDTTGHPLATQAIYSMYDQYYSPEDIASWQYFMNITMIPVARTIGVGTTSPATCALEVELCAEGNADLSYIMAMCSSPTTFYGSDTVSMALWLERVYQDGDPPLVISISYGADEVLVSDQEQRDFSQAALLLGNMGVTIVVSSGDDGVHSSNARNNYSSCGYMPGFPATSPYVVSVGATQGLENYTPEIVSSVGTAGDSTSGGGFSTIIPQPAWQKDAVDAYFQIVDGTAKAPVPGYARGGRGFPDVAVLANSFIAVVGGTFIGMGGTSLSTPTFAGMVSLVNAARLRGGGSPVGFINPTLYKDHALFFNDITVGRNNCTGLITCCKEGFEATAGWDPASGLGSIDFRKFRDHMLSIVNIPIPMDKP